MRRVITNSDPMRRDSNLQPMDPADEKFWHEYHRQHQDGDLLHIGGRICLATAIATAALIGYLIWSIL